MFVDRIKLSLTVAVKADLLSGPEIGAETEAQSSMRQAETRAREWRELVRVLCRALVDGRLRHDDFLQTRDTDHAIGREFMRTALSHFGCHRQLSPRICTGCP
jgi:hypothetical protein